MSWRDVLAAKLASTLRVEAAGVVGAVKLSMSWSEGDIDIPAVCNHLSRHFKVKSVTIIRRTPVGHTTSEGSRSAVLRIAGLDSSTAQELQSTLCKDLPGLAKAIVSSGT
jgi:hypothetical protein